VHEGEPAGALACSGDDQAGDLDELSLTAHGGPGVALGSGQVNLGAIGVSSAAGHDGKQHIGDRVHGGRPERLGGGPLREQAAVAVSETLDDRSHRLHDRVDFFSRRVPVGGSLEHCGCGHGATIRLAAYLALTEG
jgi:hypothetical protein